MKKLTNAEAATYLKRAAKILESLPPSERKVLIYALYSPTTTLFADATEDFAAEDYRRVDALAQDLGDFINSQIAEEDGPGDAHVVAALAIILQGTIQQTASPNSIPSVV